MQPPIQFRKTEIDKIDNNSYRSKNRNNPVAGKGTAIDHLPTIKDLLGQDGFDLTVCLTEAPGHAAEIAQRFAKHEHTAVIATGGDGTCGR